MYWWGFFDKNTDKTPVGWQNERNDLSLARHVGALTRLWRRMNAMNWPKRLLANLFILSTSQKLEDIIFISSYN